MWTLVVMGHGRWPYLTKALESVEATVGLSFFDRKVAAFDGCHPPDEIRTVFDSVWASDTRKGLAANLGRAWGLLDRTDEWVLHLEEDFVLVDAPLEEMAAVLDANRDVAQMALVRQPWSPEERDGMLFGPHIDGDLVDEHGWLRQSRIFTLNPHVAHASLLRSVNPAVEVSLTGELVERGFTFGFFGGLHDDPRCLHIGAEGGMGTPGWRP